MSGHYRAPGLIERLAAALPDGRLSGAALAGLDQFHTRGLAATVDLARLAGVTAEMAVLDLGSGVGGPARYLAETFGCRVVGLDLSPEFVAAAGYLTERCGLSERVRFQVGDATALPFPKGSFDLVWMQHVAMNIADRAGLYAGVHRVLRPGGRFVTYDVVQRDGALVYPVPWARAASDSFVVSAAETRVLLEAAGFEPVVWQDDTDGAAAWFAAAAGRPPAPGPNLGLVMGADFPVVAGNLGRNVREGRAGILSAVVRRG